MAESAIASGALAGTKAAGSWFGQTGAALIAKTAITSGQYQAG
jgi:hypothetical protein